MYYWILSQFFLYICMSSGLSSVSWTVLGKSVPKKFIDHLWIRVSTECNHLIGKALRSVINSAADLDGNYINRKLTESNEDWKINVQVWYIIGCINCQN